MANTSAGQPTAGALPTFGMQPIASTGDSNFSPVPGAVPDASRIGATWATGFGKIAGTLGDMAETSAKYDAQEAGRVAGLDPNYRPSGWESVAYQKAALGTYKDQLEAKARTAAGAAWETYQKLPVDQRDPNVFLKTLSDEREKFIKGDVFPEVTPDFEKGWNSLTQTYSRAAQEDFDRRTLDNARAGKIANQTAAAATAHRIASLPSSSDPEIRAQIDAHDKLLDAAVNQGQFAAAQAQTMKEKFLQSVLQTRAMALFDNAPDADRPHYLKMFAADYSGDYAAMVRAKESGGDDGARSATSSSGGRYGFTEGTWADLSAQHPELKLTPQGRFEVDQQEKAFAAFTAGNRAALAAAGKEASPANLYMAHFLGAAGARDFLSKLEKDPAASAAAAFPKEAAANKGVFYKPDGTPRSLNEVYALQTKGFGEARTAGLSKESYDWLVARMQHSVASVQQRGEQAQREAIADISATKRQIADGFDVTPAAWSLMANKYAASPDAEVRAAFDQASAVRSMVAGFTGKSPTEVEAQIANMRAAVAGGASPQQAERVKDAESWLTKYRSDLAENPVGRYARDFGARVTPLDLSSPEAIGGSLAARAPVAEQAAKQYGLPTPRYLMPDDMAAFKTLAANGGPLMTQAAGAIMSSMGPRGAQVLREIGGDAPAFVTAARVSAWGGDPQFLADFAEWHRLSSDPATKKAMELPNRKAADEAFSSTLGHSLLALPDYNTAARTAAMQAFEVRALRNGYDRSLPDSAARGELSRAVNQALGATYDGDVQYGGVASRSVDWFTSEQVLAPGNMRADRVGPALASLTDDDLKALPAQPLYDNGAAVPARVLSGARMVSVGRGKYAVASGDPTSKDTTYFKDANGNRFVLDLNALEDRLRARMPSAYR